MAALAPEKTASAPGPQTVYFKFNSDELTEKSQQYLATVVRDYKLAKPRSVNAITYTDLSGSKEYNARLAAMRGKSLEGQLKQSGVEAIKVDARGGVEPVVDTSKPNQENRRAVIVFN